MKPPSRLRPQHPQVVPTRSSHSSLRAKAVHSTAPILPFCTYYDNPIHKVSECNIPFKDFFCDYWEKKGHQEAIYFAKFLKWKQLWLPWQIYQHFLLPLNQKPRHLNLPFRLCPPKITLIRMLRRRSTMLTRGRCFKPMPLKFKLYEMNSNHWKPNLLI